MFVLVRFVKLDMIISAIMRCGLMITGDCDLLVTYGARENIVFIDRSIGDGPSERNPIRTKAFFDLIERKISF